MAKFPALPLWTDALLADTGHLQDEAFGRYMRLLIMIWRSPQCRVPNDQVWIEKRVPMSWPLVEEFCLTTGNWITQKRLLKEWRYCKRTSEKNTEAAKARWRKEKKPSDRIVQASVSHANGIAPTPTPTPTPKEDLFERSPARATNGAQKGLNGSHGTRWASDRVVPDDWLEAAGMKRAEHGLAPINMRLTAEQFANYWSGKSGQNATKVDWSKTFLNWALRTENPRHGAKPSAHENFAAGALLAAEEFDKNH